MDIVTSVNLSTVTILALLMLFMKFTPYYLNRLATYGLAIFLIPVVIAVAGRQLGWFEVDVVKIVSLRQGAFSVIAATGYGLMVGVILYSSKLHLVKVFRNLRSHS